MAKLSVEQQTQLSAQESFSKAKNLLQQDSGLKKIDPHLKFQFDDEKCMATARGQKIDACLKVQTSGKHSKVVIEVDLPFLLTPFKRQIQDALESKLKQVFS